MKPYQLAALALLAGTSALAFAPSASAPTDPAKEPAALTSWQEPDAGAGNPDLDLAVDPDAADTGEADTSTTGVGGPEEPIETAAATTTVNGLDLTPRPATHNYPACSPGPGDDNCIQLYEPGVRQALASWTGPSGGLAGEGETRMAAIDPYEAVGEGTSQTAMGGPYEPVEGNAETAMNGDGAVDGALGETAETEGATD